MKEFVEAREGDMLIPILFDLTSRIFYILLIIYVYILQCPLIEKGS